MIGEPVDDVTAQKLRLSFKNLANGSKKNEDETPNINTNKVKKSKKNEVKGNENDLKKSKENESKKTEYESKENESYKKKQRRKRGNKRNAKAKNLLINIEVKKKKVTNYDIPSCNSKIIRDTVKPNLKRKRCNNKQNLKSISKVKNEKEIDNEVKLTEDGFRITSVLPPDDSDISDAFESDVDDSEWMEEVESRKNNKHDESKNSVDEPANNETELAENLLLEEKISKIKPPLLKFLDSFDLTKDLCLDQNNKLAWKKITKPEENEKKLIKEKIPLIIFDHSQRRGKKKKEAPLPDEDILKKDQPPIEMDAKTYFKRARYDVFKLAISGLSTEDKKAAKLERLVKLGAKPPKKPYINYKVLMEQKKQEKLLKLDKHGNSELGIKEKKEKTVNKKSLNIVPLAGKFKAGVLTLSKKDIDRIKSSK